MPVEASPQNAPPNASPPPPSPATGTPAALAPLLPGEVCTQFIRCGKPECRCSRGRLHGPYYYRIWREGLRTRKVYVKAADVEAVQAGCDGHRALLGTLRDLRRERAALTRRLTQAHRRTRRLIRKLF